MPASEHLNKNLFGNTPRWSPEQALEVIHSLPETGFVEGPTARGIMRAANIRSWPIHGMASEYKADTLDMNGEPTKLYPEDVVHTAQSHLHIPTLRKYLRGEEPTTSPDTGEGPYDPEVAYNRDTGSIWMDEGHHRLIASRLRGDSSRNAWLGSFEMRRR